MPKDYSGDVRWEACRKRYALAQRDYPLGLGIKKVRQMKFLHIGWQPLWQVSPSKLEFLIEKLTEEFSKYEKKHNRNH